MSTKQPSWLQNSVFYQVYLQSFYDSNGDGIGDLNGVIAKLDYIQSLGVTAIWLSPCFVSPFMDAGYDVADFYKVAPRYGTNADLKRLFVESHKRGIKVCLDLVAGHTSNEHPWFKESAKHTRNAYSDRYIWTPSVWNGGDGSMGFINGFAERDGNYAINFFWCQPALNYGFTKPNPELPWQQSINAPGPKANRAELKKIMKYWLDMGADGFRVDMASSLVKNDPDKKEITRLWQGFRKWFDTNYPEAVLVAEWSNPTEAITAGYHIDFMIHFNTPGYPQLLMNKDSFFRKAGNGDIRKFLDSYLEQWSRTKGKGYISIPSGNHDFERPRNGGRTLEELKVIFTMLLTWPGVPFIYYGDEIGMEYIKGLPSKEGGYSRTGTRTPMQWSSQKNAGFSMAPADKLYLPVDTSKNRPTVAAQDKDSKSLLGHVRALSELRHGCKALQADADMVPVYAIAKKFPFVYLRTTKTERFLIAVNPTDKTVSVTVDVGMVTGIELKIGTGVSIKPVGKKFRISMDGVSSGVWQLI